MVIFAEQMPRELTKEMRGCQRPIRIPTRVRIPQ